MLKQLLFAFFVFLSATGNAQDYVGDKREKVKKKFERYLQHIGATDRFAETDSSLTLQLQDPKFKPVTFTFLFDQQNECIAEVRTGCDTCIASFLDYALNKKYHDWIQTGANQFLSSSQFRLLMEVVAGKTGSTLVIRKLFLNRREYLKLLKEKKVNAD